MLLHHQPIHFRLDNKSAGRHSVASNLMKPDDEVDDADSMAAYGEGDTGKVSFLIIKIFENFSTFQRHKQGVSHHKNFFLFFFFFS